MPRERDWTSGHSTHPWRPLGEWVPLGPLALDPPLPTMYPAGRLYAEDYEMQGIGGGGTIHLLRYTIDKKKKRNGYFEMPAKLWLCPGHDWRVDLDNLALSKLVWSRPTTVWVGSIFVVSSPKHLTHLLNHLRCTSIMRPWTLIYRWHIEPGSLYNEMTVLDMRCFLSQQENHIFLSALTGWFLFREVHWFNSLWTHLSAVSFLNVWSL